MLSSVSTMALSRNMNRTCKRTLVGLSLRSYDSSHHVHSAAGILSNCFFRSSITVKNINITSSRHSYRRAFSPITGEDQDLYAAEEIPETGEWAGCKRSFMAPLLIPTRGPETLYNPLFNKGTAFKKGERDRLRFRGLLPSRIMNIQLQKDRFLQTLRAETSKIKQNILLEDLHDRNETLYHRVLVDHVSNTD